MRGTPRAAAMAVRLPFRGLHFKVELAVRPVALWAHRFWTRARHEISFACACSVLEPTVSLPLSLLRLHREVPGELIALGLEPLLRQITAACRPRNV